MSIKDDIQRVKDFADINFCKDEDDPTRIFADDDEEEFAVTNPWLDCSGRFPLNDVQAVEEWGLPIVVSFIIKALKIIGGTDLFQNDVKLEQINDIMNNPRYSMRGGLEAIQKVLNN